MTGSGDITLETPRNSWSRAERLRPGVTRGQEPLSFGINVNGTLRVCEDRLGRCGDSESGEESAALVLSGLRLGCKRSLSDPTALPDYQPLLPGRVHQVQSLPRSDCMNV